MRLLVIDGNSIANRAFYGIKLLTTKDGRYTNAIFGFLNIMNSLLRECEPDEVAVAFDLKHPTFRHEMYDGYKGTRHAMPDELAQQMPILKELLTDLGYRQVSAKGWEADDILGTLAAACEARRDDCFLATGDRDSLQLVSETTTVLLATSAMGRSKTETMDLDAIHEKYGIEPKQLIEVKSLMGDTSDNIPGVSGVGEKTALGLLQGIGSMAQIYANLDKVAELPIRGAKKLGEKLLAEKDMADLSYALATIKTDVALAFSPQELALGDSNNDALIEYFGRYEFKRWLGEVMNGTSSVTQPTQSVKINHYQATPAVKTDESAVENSVKFKIDRSRYENILTETDLARWVEKLSAEKLIAVDTETDGLDYMSANLVGVSFALENGEAAYLPLHLDYLGAPKTLEKSTALAVLKPILENPNIGKVGQNLKFDMTIFARNGIALQGIEFDTMLLSYTLDSTGRHNMDDLAKRYLGHQTIGFEDIAGKGKNQLTFNQIALEEAGRYAAEDADVTLQLHLKMWPKLQKHEGPLNVFQHIEMPLVPVLSRIERNGVKIDPTVLHNHSGELAQRLTELEQKAHELAGEPFNLSSPKQLQTILFEKQGIKPLKKTPGGAPSTSEEVLEELALDYPLPKVILQYRGLAKLKSTYTDKLPLMINPKTGRVHTSYHQAVAATGRLSSTDPNLQNIPVRNEEGRRIRQAFIAPEDYLIVSADYSQIELRIMAHLSRDKGLLTAFAEGKDIHRATAAEVFGLPLDSVTNEQRRSAKAINFGLIYGMSAFGLSRQLNIPRKESQKYMDLYFERYPGVLEYMERTRAQAKEKGYVETLDGRRLYLPDIKSSNAARRAGAERAAINAPMQGTAADIIKRAMIAVDAWLEKEKPRVKMIMQVHDELVFEVHKDDVDAVAKQIHQLMENCTRLDVPLLVEVGSGENWDQAH